MVGRQPQRGAGYDRPLARPGTAATMAAVRLLALAALGLTVAAAGGAPAASAETIRLGRGIGAWRLEMTRVVRPGLLRSIRYPRNIGPGCTLGPQTASRIDFYRGLRLSWLGIAAEARRPPFLSDVATTRAGDQSGDGFVIGKSRLQAVRRAHPRGDLTRARDRFALGHTSLRITRVTGYEAFVYLVYWFDRSGTLRALQTGAGGC